MAKKLYSGLKFINFPEQLSALQNNRLAAPVHIRIKPFNHCNHDCWYCAYRVSNLQLGAEMDVKDVLPESKMFEIADDAIAMGVKAITFSGGGEPLLYKPLPDVMRRLSEGGVRVAALTNGSNLKGRVADAFAAYGTWVRISIDAVDDDAYASTRRIKQGSFSAVIDNLRAFSARKSRCVLGISFIISQANYDQILTACRLFKDCGVSHVSLSGVVVSNDGRENNLYHAPFRDAAIQNIEQARALEDDTFTIINNYHELQDRFDKSYTSCPFLQFQTVIGADAKVYACHDKAFNTAGLLGDISNRSFREFWFSDENKTRIDAINPSVHCRHHCVAHSRNLLLNELLSIDPDHLAFV